MLPPCDMLTTKKWTVASAPGNSPGKSAVEGGELLGLEPEVRFFPVAFVALILSSLVFLSGCSPAGTEALQTGQKLIEEGKPAEAIEPLKRAVVNFATNNAACAQAWNYLGLAYHHAGRPNDADLAYQRALAKDFNLFAARYNRGCLLLEQNQLSGAINELTTFTAHEPEHLDAWLRLGSAQYKSKLYDAAEASYQKAKKLADVKELKSAQVETLNGLGMIQSVRRRPREAFQYFQTALSIQTNYAPALLNQAILAQHQFNDRAFALQRYKAWLELCPNDPNQPAIVAAVKQIEWETRPPAQPVTPTNPPTVIRPQTNVAAAITSTSNTAVASTPTTESKTALSNTNRADAPAKPATPNTATNLASAPTAATNAAPVSQKTPPPTHRSETRPPAKPTQDNTPLQVVQLTTEPEIKAAQDFTPQRKPATNPPPALTVTNLAVVPTNTAPAAETTTDPNNTPALALPDSSKPEKKSFVKKLNPLGWFKSKDKEKSEEAGSKAAKAEPIAPVATPQKVQPPPAPPVPTYPNYTYRNPAKPVPGNRAEALRAFGEGVQAVKESRASDALNSYQKAVQSDPSFFDAQYNLGATAYDTGNWNLALAAYEDALAIKPSDAAARFNFALTLERAGFPVDAANEMEKLVNSNPSDANAHFSLGGLYAVKLLQPSKARSHYQRVLELQPNHPQAEAIRAWLGR
jgi:tetratricopeptide (TPR) repeat protein